MAIQKIVGQDFLLSYPNFGEEFKIHTDVRKTQIGRVISCKWEFRCLLLALFNPHLINYINTGRKMFVETLVLSGPGHQNAHGLFLAPCRPQYVFTGFLC